MTDLKFKVAGVMYPKNLGEFLTIEDRLLLNKNDFTLKQEFEECLKKCVCLELVQIKDFVSNQESAGQEAIMEATAGGSGSNNTSYLELRTRRTGSSSMHSKLSSNILFLGQIGLDRLI